MVLFVGAKMRVRIDVDEMWPCYSVVDISDKYGVGHIHEVPDELVDEAKAISDKFDEIQRKLEKIYESGGK